VLLILRWTSEPFGLDIFSLLYPFFDMINYLMEKIAVRNAKKYEEEGDYLEAAKWYKYARQLENEAKCYEKAGRFHEAAEIYSIAGLRNLAAQCYEKAGDYESAADQYQALAERENKVYFWKKAYENYKKGGNTIKAIECLWEYAKGNPECQRNLVQLCSELEKEVLKIWERTMR